METTPAKGKFKMKMWHWIAIGILALGLLIVATILIHKARRKSLIKQIMELDKTKTEMFLDGLSYHDLNALLNALKNKPTTINTPTGGGHPASTNVNPTSTNTSAPSPTLKVGSQLQAKGRVLAFSQAGWGPSSQLNGEFEAGDYLGTVQEIIHTGAGAIKLGNYSMSNPITDDEDNSIEEFYITLQSNYKVVS